MLAAVAMSGFTKDSVSSVADKSVFFIVIRSPGVSLFFKIVPSSAFEVSNILIKFATVLSALHGLK